MQPRQSGETACPLDLAPLTDVFEDDEVGLVDFVLDALCDLESAASGFEDALAARDVPASRALAHTLKGAYANIGAIHVASAMADAEGSITTQDWTVVENAWTRAKTTMHDAMTWATTRKKELS